MPRQRPSTTSTTRGSIVRATPIAMLAVAMLAAGAAAQDRDAQRSRLHQQLNRANVAAAQTNHGNRDTAASRMRSNLAAQQAKRDQRQHRNHQHHNQQRVYTPFKHSGRHGTFRSGGHSYRDRSTPRFKQHYPTHYQPRHYQPKHYQPKRYHPNICPRTGVRLRVTVGGHFGGHSGGYGHFVPPRVYRPYSPYHGSDFCGPRYPGSVFIVRGGYSGSGYGYGYGTTPIVNDLGPIDPRVSVNPVPPAIAFDPEPVGTGPVELAPIDLLERARWHLASGRPLEAIDDYRMHLHDSDAIGAGEARREFGIALLEAGRQEEGISVIAAAYRRHAELADRPIDRAVFGSRVTDRLEDLVVAVGRVANHPSNRLDNPDAWLVAAVLIEAQDRPHRVKTPLRRAVEAGLDPATAERLNESLLRQMGVGS